MNVYLPHRHLTKCVAVLDTSTLTRQRENAEMMLSYILFKCGELSLSLKYIKKCKELELDTNPFFLYWWNNGKPFGIALFKYLDNCNFELFNRKKKLINITTLKKVVLNSKKLHHGSPPRPKRITTGYRIILLCRDTKYYKNIFFLTYKKNIDLINKLKNSTEKFKFAKFLGLI